MPRQRPCHPACWSNLHAGRRAKTNRGGVRENNTASRKQKLLHDRDRQRLVFFGGNRVLFGTENDKDTFVADMWEWE